MVVGGSSGIGYACCTEIVTRGGQVILVDHDKKSGAKAALDLGDNATFISLDVTQEDQWERVYEAVVARKGRLDGLINSACVFARHDNIEELSDEQWQRLMEFNRDATFYGCRYAIRIMQALGCGGSIVNISSIVGLVGDGNAISYSTGQGAIRMLTKCVALYCAREKLGIRCNSVHPGRVGMRVLAEETEGSGNKLEHDSREAPFFPHLDGGKVVDYEGVAATTEFLLSEESSFITGSQYVVDEGYSAI